MFVILDRAVGGTDRLGSLSLLQAATEAHLPQKLSVLRVDDFLFYVNSLSVVARNPYLKISVAHPQFWGCLL